MSAKITAATVDVINVFKTHNCSKREGLSVAMSIIGTVIYDKEIRLKDPGLVLNEITEVLSKHGLLLVNRTSVTVTPSVDVIHIKGNDTVN